MKMNIIRKVSITMLFSLCVYTAVPHNAYGAVYKVVKNDSLFKISRVFNTSPQNIIKDNKLISPVIYEGQKLVVSSKTYAIKKGDTFFLLAKKFGITVNALKTANSYTTNKLDIGQIINIPPVSLSTTQKVVVKANTNYSAMDIDLLARLITAEAQGESFQAKVAVGAVVMNRVKSGIFPNSISGVINQREYGYYQFTPVLNGWINKPADQSSITAAYAAINGNDPSSGSLYYFDTTNTNKWLWSKQVSTQIGKLIFVL